MAESFESWDNILRDWAKEKCRGIEQVREARKRKIKLFLLKTKPEKVLEQSQSAVKRDKHKHKIGLGKPKTIAISRI